MRNHILVFLIGLTYLSCESPVSFNEPQPADTKNLNEFPNSLKGDYYNKADNVFLNISEKQILKIYDLYEKISKTELDSSYKLIGDTLYNLSDSSKTFVKFDGDSLIFHFHSEDTLFDISKRNILRQFKGYFFLSIGDSTSWDVKKLYLKKGVLSISSITTNEDINILRNVTETAMDTTSFNFHPTIRQFGNFIKKNGFQHSEYYVRLRKQK